MAKVRVPLHGKPQGYATVDTAATEGAIVGQNLRWPDGSPVTEAQLRAAATPPAQGEFPITYWRLIQEIPPNVVALANRGTTGLYVITAAGESATRAIEVADGELTVDRADGVNGNPLLGLADIGDAGGGLLQRFERDAKGRVVGTSAATTDDLDEGAANLYHTDERAQDAVGAVADGTGDVQLVYETSPARRLWVRLSAAISGLIASALQPGDNVSELANDAGYVDAAGAGAAAPVQSVNGKTGAVELSAGDVGADASGSAAAALSAATAYADGKVVDSIADGDTTRAPSRKAVFDALADKEPSIASGTTGQLYRGDKTFSNTLEGDFNTKGKIRVLSDDPYEADIVVQNEGGGTAVLHYRRKFPGVNFSPNGALLGGAGSRPWVGSGYSTHSTAAYHLAATENHTATAQGTAFNILATPNGGSHSSRVIAATFNGGGDLINSRGVTSEKLNPLERGRGIEIVRLGNTAEISMASNFPTAYATLFRGYTFSGTLESPGATEGGRGSGYALCGHDGTQFVGAKALISLFSSEPWSLNSTPTYMAFETTAPGSVARTQRWRVDPGGDFAPATDAAYRVGRAGARVSEFWGATGTINTSDAREKTTPRDMIPAEIECGLAIARLPCVFQFLASVAEKGEDEARLHVGPTVQAVIATMEAHGLVPFRYSFVCYDEWGETPEIRDPISGEIVQEYRADGNRFSLRPSGLEAFCRRALVADRDALEARIVAVESGKSAPL